MIFSQLTKSGILIKPQSLATTATATGQVDTYGWNYLTVTWSLDSAAAVSSNPATLKLSEDNATTTTTNDIAAFVGDGVGGFTVPNASTDTPQVLKMCVDLTKARKRYITGHLTPAGATQLVGATYELSRGDLSPRNASEAGCAALVIG